MWGKDHPKDNLESWQDIQQFIAEIPDSHDWSKWKQMVRQVISDLESRGLAPLFRIGQSMHHVIFSTLEHHRLASEPRVTLEFHTKEQKVRIAYSYANLYFSEPSSEEYAPVSSAASGTIRYLRRLWEEARPSSPIPDALNL
jgi:hypothetical protein